jgi:hypothetical protein
VDERFGLLGLLPRLLVLLILLLLRRAVLAGRLSLLGGLSPLGGLGKHRLCPDPDEKDASQKQQDGPTCDVGEHKPRLENPK